MFSSSLNFADFVVDLRLTPLDSIAEHTIVTIHYVSSAHARKIADMNVCDNRTHDPTLVVI